MTYNELKQWLAEYNWHDRYDTPQQVLENQNCDLALALELFYLGDGYAYYEKISQGIKIKEWQDKWRCFISQQYEGILSGKSPKTRNHYEIPLSRVERYKLRKSGMPEIFLTDL